ncbi:S41 family peptidase [Lentibacillus cibarius]|uniref:S41 family peptidase n=1 Tax=Lentibacillus cibarius TaxID=2583219 RepID=UPI002D779A27|nr:PDZ domain-containing protein [Lentibacillus cibarius]
MKLQKQHIIMLLFAALVLGFAGAYAGVKLAQPGPASDQELAGMEQVYKTGERETPAKFKSCPGIQFNKENYLEDVKDKQLIEGAIQGMVGSLEDPYSSYMDKETMKQFNQTIESSFEGIGAEVSKVNGKITIVSPIKDSPAEKAGLRPNDQILSVAGESVAGLNLQEAVQRFVVKRVQK